VGAEARPAVTVLTGSRTGIGRSLAEHLVAAGHEVVGISRQESDFRHARYRHLQGDVGDEADVRRMAGSIRRELGRVDHLVNNAGIAAMNHALLTPGSTAERVLRTNTLGTFLMCREVARLMVPARFGRIVNFTTVAVPLALEGEAVYVASKAGVEALTRVLAREFAGFGITVNALGLGPVDTALTRGVPPEKLKAVIDRQAVRRPPTFGDIAHALEFLLAPASAMITGQVLYLGGV
jgi:3-oxoacyl-[acyl-carrier protein] reductase